MKRFLKRLSFYHWIAILFAVLLLGTLILQRPYSRELPETRAWNLYHQMDRAFSEKVPKNSFSYYRVDYYQDENKWLDILDRWELVHKKWKVMLEIGVTDEAVIDDFLASWTGEGWDKLVKIPDSCSRARQEEFLQRAKALDWGPGVDLEGYAVDTMNAPGLFSEVTLPMVRVWAELILGTPAEGTEADWLEMPQQLKDLAKEMGVPEEIIDWREPRGRAEPSEDLVSAEADPPEPVPAPEPDHAGDPDWPLSGEDPDTGPPDMGPQENPDTSVMYTDEENAAWQREFAFVDEIDDAFSQNLPKECYSYFYAYGEGTGNEMKLVLEIGVTDEAALDAYLAAWTGTKWDKLVKKPGRASQAKQEEFAERANKLDLGPDVYLEVRPDGGSTNTEYGKILVSVGNKRWRDAEQAVKDLAKEMGIPEDMLSYLEPRSTGSVNPDGTVTNPDT